MKHIIITLILSYFSNYCFSQNISEKHLYTTKSIQYDGNIFKAFEINIVPLVEDSIVITKFWIGKRRYFNSNYLNADGNREWGIYILNKVHCNWCIFEGKIVIYNSLYYNGRKVDEKIQRKYLPPFTYNGIALVEYYYQNKKYYYVIKKVDKKIWYGNYNGEVAPDLDPEGINGYQRKQQ